MEASFPFLLYFILFSPFPLSFLGVTIEGSVLNNEYNAVSELFSLLTWQLPAILFIVSLYVKNDNPSKVFIPKLNDIVIALVAFFFIFISGSLVTFAETGIDTLFGMDDSSIVSALPLPKTAFGWIVLFFGCMGTGYLEELFFRLYLPVKLQNYDAYSLSFKYIVLPKEKAAVKIKKSFIVPLLLFGLSHVWEGPFGIANAVLAGIILYWTFRRTRSFHGIALSHGIYDFAVFVSFAL